MARERARGPSPRVAGWAGVSARLGILTLGVVLIACSREASDVDERSRFGTLSPDTAWRHHLRGRHNGRAVSGVEILALSPLRRQKPIVFTRRTPIETPVVAAAAFMPDEQRFCPSGMADCNHEEADGCEASVLWSVEHCGGCGIVCEAAFAGWNPVCTDGVCGRQCPSGQYDRDGLAWNGCEYRCRPRSGIDVLDDRGVDSDCDGYDGVVADSVFVRQGASGTLGSPADPLGSIADAVILAQRTNRHHVLVGVGEYRENVRLANGVSIHGGFDTQRAWAQTRRARDTAILGRWEQGRSRRIVRGEELTERTVIERVRIENSAIGTLDAGTDVLGLWCNRCPGLSLRNVTVDINYAVNGAPGRDGGNGASGWAGRPGKPGDGDYEAEIGGAGGRGAQAHCGAMSVGGNGGAGGGSEQTRGRPGDGTTRFQGGDGGGMGEGGEDGRSGENGLAGFVGASGQAWARTLAGYFAAQDGGDGGDGSAGGGGAGGGGGGGQTCMVFCDEGVGNGGGGGGSGGCGGRAGRGGLAGGGLFGVVLMGGSAGAELINVEIRTGAGGDGGNGGLGGGGGAGGPGGAGGRVDSDEVGAGGDGGSGGAGGPGGQGGAGAGGSSVALYCDSQQVYSRGLRLNAGIPGRGGVAPVEAAPGLGFTALECPGIRGREIHRPGASHGRRRGRPSRSRQGANEDGSTQKTDARFSAGETGDPEAALGRAEALYDRCSVTEDAVTRRRLGQQGLDALRSVGGADRVSADVLRGRLQRCVESLDGT